MLPFPIRCHSIPIILLLAVSSAATARTVVVDPTGTAADYGRVKAAMERLSAGDTLVLGAGLFDWSENVADTLAASGLPGGLAITVDRLTITGRRGAVLRGKRDARGEPARLPLGANMAFRNAPGADGITIRGLALEGFEDAVMLLQADSLGAGRPHDAFRHGTRGWVLEDLWIRGGPFGIAANGRHRDLTVRRCRFEMDPGRRMVGRRGGSFALSVRPFPPLYDGLPDGVVVEDNLVRGPGTASEEMHGGIIVTGDNARIRRNDIERYGMGLVVEGQALDVSGNRASRCGIGILAWTTGRLGTRTDGARICRNEIRGMSLQPGGFLSGFSGTGILLAGVTGSEISGNILADNPGADIVFGAAKSTPASTGNRVFGNTGRIKLSRDSLERNTVEGSQVIVIDTAAPNKTRP